MDYMKLHKGAILREAIEESGVTITSIINKIKKHYGHIKCSRTKLYQLFKQEEIDNGFLQIIGKIIYYDFSKDIPELKKESFISAGEGGESSYQISITSELVFIRNEHAKLQKSYIELLSLLTKIANENRDYELKKEIEVFLNKGKKHMK